MKNAFSVPTSNNFLSSYQRIFFFIFEDGTEIERRVFRTSKNWFQKNIHKRSNVVVDPTLALSKNAGNVVRSVQRSEPKRRSGQSLQFETA